VCVCYVPESCLFVSLSFTVTIHSFSIHPYIHRLLFIATPTTLTGHHHPLPRQAFTFIYHSPSTDILYRLLITEDRDINIPAIVPTTTIYIRLRTCFRRKHTLISPHVSTTITLHHTYCIPRTAAGHAPPIIYHFYPETILPRSETLAT
jgi:hypothetical protein